MHATETDRTETAAETFIIAKTDEGFRVCSPLTPAKQYIVSGLPDDPRCTYPEFARHDGEPDWLCKHLEAVLKHAGGTGGPKELRLPAETATRAADAKPARPEKRPPKGQNGGDAMMLLKRSVGPDGRIDSLSVEFSCPVGRVTAEEIRQRAARILGHRRRQ